jgi:hypothetical protein
VIAGLMISMSKAPAPGRAATAAACDQAVHMLLTTESMVELERAKYLILLANHLSQIEAEQTVKSLLS